MTFTEAAAHVLRLVGKPLHYKEITDVAIERGLLSHVGKSPEVTMGARLAAQVKKAEKDNPLARVKPGVFALSDWDEKKIEAGLSDRTPAIERMRQAEAELAAAGPQDDSGEPSEGESAAPTELPSSPAAAHRDLSQVDSPPDEAEQRRAELSAAATDLFESEDDDDQPIFGAPERDADEGSSKDSADGDSDGKRRRRRRRGRGRKDEETSDEGGDDLPTYTVSDAGPDELPESEDEPTPSFSVESSDSEVSLADALEAVLAKYDRGKGPVGAQNVADAMRRKGGSDASLNAAAVTAIALADNLAAERECRVPRFRIAGNKLGLTSWVGDRRLVEKQRAVARASEQLREATVRALSDELKRLPHRAVGELVTVLLSRMGMANPTAVRRPGAHGSELHLAAVATMGAMSIPTAIMVRRDGKDIGRERVTELRGALHHYGPATQGILVTTGQVLSGAREEAQTKGASPVTLCGRNELAELCVTYGVGVRTQRIEVPMIDIELLENFQGR